MANVKRGEVKVMLDKERTLKYTLNALAEVEDKGIDLTQLDGKVSIKTLRTLLHAGLIHEDPELTEIELGNMITFDNIQPVQEALAAAMGGSGN